MKNLPLLSLAPVVLALSACTVMPTGPGVMVLPGPGKSFEQFRFDDTNCRQYALAQVGGVTANQAATSSAVGSAVVGTAVGALAGAALGGDHRAAAAGAGVGLLAGSSIGAGNAQYAGRGSQRGYDVAYVQCMYAAGHRVPAYGGMISNTAPPAGQGSGAGHYAPMPLPSTPPVYAPR
jgi:hypothetical protein